MLTVIEMYIKELSVTTYKKNQSYRTAHIYHLPNYTVINIHSYDIITYEIHLVFPNLPFGLF